MINDPETPPVGVFPTPEGHTLWRVWASKAKAVALVLDPRGEAVHVPMRADGRGFFSCETPFAPAGTRYGFGLDGGNALPSPCSRWQPDGLDAPSAVYYPEAFVWDDRAWRGVERSDLVFYELHVGTFTREGTFDAIIPRLDALRDLGITAIELMPVGQFAGARSWGYDGVHPFAPQSTYGGPEGLQRLVQACHSRGLAVFLDVVYNHFGPEGNHFTTFGDYLTDKTQTDWGPALNFDQRNCDPVRAMVLENVRMWIKDYHFDGLRFDAADQIYDRSPRHVLSEAVEVAHAEGEKQGKCVHVFAETDFNDAPRFLNPHSQGGYGFDGHWNDDFHHAAHATLTGESNGYYADFQPGPQALLKALREGFVNNGNYSPFRGRRHGTTARNFPGDRLVGFTQNHDQVGNRARSDRNAAFLPHSAVRLGAGLLLLAPRLPLLFMGEEYGETNPFPFFCDFQTPPLIEAVREGRKAEFAYFGWDDVPDPVAPHTRDSAVLSWDWSEPERARLRDLYRRLLRLRKELPALRDLSRHHARLHDAGGPVLELVRGAESGAGPVHVLFNLSAKPAPFPAGLSDRELLFRSEGEARAALGPHEFVILGPTSSSSSPV